MPAKFVADLHIYSRFSRACRKELNLQTFHRWAQLKGISVLATGDFTHPAWFSELRERLIPVEPGLFRLKDEWAQAVDNDIPEACRAPVRFLLGVEISCICILCDLRVDMLQDQGFLPWREEFKIEGKAVSKLSRDLMGNMALCRCFQNLL